MDNVVSFSKLKKQKQNLLSNNIFEEMDAKFRGSKLSTKQKSELMHGLRQRLSSRGHKCYLTSKKVEQDWIKRYKPLLLLDAKIGFSFEIAKEVKLEDGWVFHPLKAKQTNDYSELLSKIIQILEDSKNGK